MKNKIVVLAAGKGSRMKSELPKVLVRLLSKPLIVHLLEKIAASNYENEKIYLIVSPKNKDLIAEAVKSFNVEFILQEEQLGTGHAVRSLVKYFNENQIEAERLIVLYGDHPLISERGINRLLAEGDLSDENPVRLLTTQRLCGFNELFWYWGRILRNSDGKIIGIREFKDATDDERSIVEVNPAMMTFYYPWLKVNLNLLENKNNSGEYYLTDLIKIAQTEGKEILSGGIMPEEAIGINTPEELEKAQDILLGQNLPCPFS